MENNQIRCMTIRLNPTYETHRQALDYLEHMDRGIHRSYSDAVAQALVAYFGTLYHDQNEPDWRQRDWEDQLIQCIQETVSEEIALQWPTCVSSMCPRVPHQVIPRDLLDEKC